MAEPKKQLTRTRSGNRRSHNALHGISLGVCKKCGAPKRPHQVCGSCGSYNGQTIITPKHSK